jgi:hypothetical protein
MAVPVPVHRNRGILTSLFTPPRFVFRVPRVAFSMRVPVPLRRRFFAGPETVGVALPLAGSVDIVMRVIVWHVGGRIDVFFVLLTSLRKLPSHTQRASS